MFNNERSNIVYQATKWSKLFVNGELPDLCQDTLIKKTEDVRQQIKIPTWLFGPWFEQ